MPAPGILEVFGLAGGAPPPRCVALIGGGGKTTLMFALAHAAVAAGRRVVTTTTTRILPPGPAESPRLLTLADGALAPRLRTALAETAHVTVAAALDVDAGKLSGLAPGDVDAIVAGGLADLVLVEADGSAGRPLKAHAAHEPVIPASTDLVVAVVGAAAVGAPLDGAHVHRAPLFAGRLGRPMGTTVGPDDVVAILYHPEGWLARLRQGVPALLFVVARGPAEVDAAARVARAARAHDRGGRLGAIVTGDARHGVSRAGVAPR
jgi:probable selenium-dependent hydroxylase accessory protein YqeC